MAGHYREGSAQTVSLPWDVCCSWRPRVKQLNKHRTHNLDEIIQNNDVLIMGMCFIISSPVRTHTAPHSVYFGTLVTQFLRFGQFGLIVLCFVFYLQAAGSVQDSEGLHDLPAWWGLLPGTGSSRCSPPHAHACRGELLSYWFCVEKWKYVRNRTYLLVQYM